MVVQDEIARTASGGIMLGLAGTQLLYWIMTSLFLGYGIALPPVLRFGGPHLKQKMRDVITGRKVICLNVTEPYVYTPFY